MMQPACVWQDGCNDSAVANGWLTLEHGQANVFGTKLVFEDS